MFFMRLAWRSLRRDRARFLSATFGVAAAVALLCWHVGLAMTAIHAGDGAAQKATAPFSAWLTGPADGRRGPGGPGRGGPGGPRGPRDAGPRPSGDAIPGSPVQAGAEATGGRRMPVRPTPIPPATMEAIKNSGAEVLPLATIAASLDVRANGRILQGPPIRGNVALLPPGGIPFEIGAIEGRLPDLASGTPEVVVNKGLFGTRVPAPAIGESLSLTLGGGTASPVVVGYFNASRMVDLFPAIYANGAAMDAVARATPDYVARPNLALLKTHNGLGSVESALSRAAAEGRAPCRLYSTAALGARFRSDTVNNLVSSLPMTLCLAVITAACLVATILLIGLSLQRKRMAELRCAGMTRFGVARLILNETVAVVLFGWAVGAILADIILRVFLLLERGGDLPAQPFFGWQTPLCGLALALVVGPAAAAVPAVAAMRVRPLEALGGATPLPRPPSPRRGLLALALALPMPLVSVIPFLDEKQKALAMGVVGMPCFVAALLLSLRFVTRLAEAIALHPICRALRLAPAMLRNRLGRDHARVAGTIVTVALALGGFVAIHVWGGTLMSSFVPSPEWPDAIVSALPNGWTDTQVAAVATCPGVEDGKVVKIDCTQKTFDADSPAFAGREDEMPLGSVLLFGADPDAAYGGEKPLAPFKFVAGEREAAIAAMREGRGCVIVSMLARLAGLRLGDKIRFAGRELEVAGIVDLNWHMVTSRSRVRTPFGREAATVRDGTGPGRTIGMVFVSEKFVRSITGNEETYFVWLGMPPELDALGGLRATVRLDSEIRAAVHDAGENAIQVHHRDEIADGTLSHGNDILGMMARIPFWSLAVAATGMVALLLASVQGWMRELRTMRAVGMTRGQMARLIFAEALLVTFSAVILGFGAGLATGWSFTGLSRWMASAGLPVRLVVPWLTILRGVGFALVLCAVMSLLPLRRLVAMIDDER